VLAVAVAAAAGFAPVARHPAAPRPRAGRVACLSRLRGAGARGDVAARQQSNALARLLLGSRAEIQRQGRMPWGTPQWSETADGIVLRTLTPEELADAGEGSKLEAVARLCTRGMFGDENEEGSCWVHKNFRAKYGEDSSYGRQSVMVVAETSDGAIIGCIGMELMLLTEEGMAWWNNPCSVVKKRPFVSDLVVDSPYRYVRRALLVKIIIATKNGL